jgi:hypothetical protein
VAIDTTSLGQAGVDTSDNPLLSALWMAVTRYNTLPPVPKGGDVARHGVALDSVLKCAGYYLTSKPPVEGKKSLARWEAMLGLAEATGAEYQTLGLQPLSGWTAMQQWFQDGVEANKKFYWLEMLDPMHRHGRDLSPQFAGWSGDSDAARKKSSFWDYIGTKMHPALNEIEVQYFPEVAGQSTNYRHVYFSGGSLKDFQGNDYSTAKESTVFNGTGWAIFVCSPAGKLYAGSHETGKRHHSSFLGGGSVSGAGEMAVYQGKVRAITCKSGHYKPDARMMLEFLGRFADIPGDAVICPDFTTGNYYRCAQLRIKQMKAKELGKAELMAAIPPGTDYPAELNLSD